MQTYVAERHLGPMDGAALIQLSARILRATAAMRADGHRIYYLCSTYLPDDGRCLCQFEADSRVLVERLNKVAALPCDLIHTAVLLAQPCDAYGVLPDHGRAQKLATCLSVEI